MDRGPTGLIPSVRDINAPRGPIQMPVPQAAMPADVQAMQHVAAHDAGDTWLADQRAEHPEQWAEGGGIEDAAKKAQLESEYGHIETIGGQFARGALDALLAPGALAGAYAETVGDTLKIDALRDFGRDLGEAASGKAALSTMAGLAQAALSGSAYKGAETMDVGAQRLEEAAEARPMLAAVSRMAGLSMAAVGLGAGASGESGALATILANAGEGAAGGAQTAYENAAPLRDVLASAAVGGLLGGGIAGAGEMAAKVIRKTPDLAKVFGEKIQDFADKRALKAVIDRDPQAWKIVTRGGEERMSRVAERIRAADVLGKGDDGMLEAIEHQSAQANAELDTLTKVFDEKMVQPNISKMEADISDQVAALKGSGSHTSDVIARRVEREITPFKRKLAIEGTDNFGQPMVIGYRNPTFSELLTFKRGLGDAIDWLGTTPLDSQMKKLWGTVSDGLNEAADQAGPAFRQQWRAANEASSDFTMLKKALSSQIEKRQVRRFISPSDYATSIGAGLAMLMHASNPVTAGITAIGAALGHKAIREGGSAMVSSLANRFARMSHHVSLLKAGGPEAQEVLSALGKTKAFMAETAERAGANPTLRQGAEETAKQVAAQQLAKKAGPFEPSGWIDKKLNPLQKVIYRRQVLDTVSGDLSKAAQAISELHPPMPESLDVRRLSKLTKDANGPEAIGALQSLVAESAKAAPATASGDAAAVALRNLGLKLERLDVPGAMQEAHAVANWLREAQEIAESSGGRIPSKEAQIVSSNGLENARYLTSGMRDESMAKVRAEMASGAPIRPVDVTIFPGDEIVLQDGRHRLAVAKELGMDELPAHISRMDEDGNIISEVMGNVTIRPGAPKPEAGAREYLARTEQALRQAISGEDWGKAGQAYAQMIAPPHEALAAMADPKALRSALAVGGSDLPATIEQINQRLADAYGARVQLSGIARPDEFTKQLAAGKKIFDAAQDAITIDGRPMANLIDAAADVSAYGVASAGHPDGNTVQKEVDKGIDKIAPVLRGSPARETAELTGTEVASREQYDQRMKALTRAVTQPDAAASSPGMYAGISGFVGQAMAQLLQDIPKPSSSVHGKPFETMSQDDLRLANAMWEATTEPLTVLSDLAAGNLDPDKSAYAWKQYPGLQRAVQAGVMDELMGLTDDQRSAVPESVLSQLDTAIGFNGALQDANTPDFAARMSALYQPAPNKPRPGGMLETPLAEPTYTERLSGQQ